MNRDLVLLAFSLITWGTGESMFLYFQPLYLQKLGADPVKIGVILGFAAIASVFVHIPAGYLADRFGRRPLIWLSWSLGMIATWMMAAANGLPVFVAGLVVYSCTYFVMAPMNSYVTAARGKWSVGRALTLEMAAFNAGSILGPSLGGVIADRIGLRSVYFIAGGVFIISTCLIFFIRSQPLAKGQVEETARGPWLNRQFMVFLGIIFLAIFVTYLPQPLAPNFLHNVKGLSYGQIGQLGSISSVGMVIMSLVLGRISPHLGFMIAQTALGLFALLLWRGNTFLLFASGYFFLGGFRTAHSLASAQTNEWVHQSRMGLAYGLTETAYSLATVLAPPLAGILYQLRPSLTFSASFIVIVFSLFVLAAYYYWPRSRPLALMYKRQRHIG